MSKHEIEIPELPEGWRPVAFRIGEPNETIIDCGEVLVLDSETKFPCLIVEKIQPRRIVLEETDEKYLGCQTLYVDGIEITIMTNKTWKQVNLSLPKDDEKLSLSVDECKSISRFLSVSSEGVTKKILEFIKGK